MCARAHAEVVTLKNANVSTEHRERARRSMFVSGLRWCKAQHISTHAPLAEQIQCDYGLLPICDTWPAMRWEMRAGRRVGGRKGKKARGVSQAGK
jgi:hypothetical protein